MATGYLFRSLTLVVATIALVSCSAVGNVGGEAPGVAPASTATTLVVESPEDAGTEEEGGRRTPQLLQMGTDQAVVMPEPRNPIRLDGEAVSLDFEQTPLVEIVHAILGDILGLDYVIEHPINGQVTLRTRSPIPRDELLPILESLLQSNDAIMVRDPNDRYYVSASKRLTSLLPEFNNPLTQGAGYTNIIVPLRYIGATEMASILKPVATDGAFVRVDNLRNLLVLAGTRNQLDGWLQIINTFDIDQLEGMSVAVFPLEYSSVEIVDSALSELLGRDGVILDGDGDSSGGERGGSAMLGGLVRILPLEGLDSMMVISPRLSYIEQIGNWIAKLDQPSDASGEPTLHVYQVQNGDATQMAELLSGLLGGGAGGGGADTGVAPGLTPLNAGGAQNSAGGQGGAAGRNSRGGRGGTQQFTLGDDIRVVADRYNNSLLVFAPQREYRKIEAALRRLDVVPKQVLIEASILEVQLIGNLRYGIEWAFNGGVGRFDGDGLFATGDSGNIGPRVPGFSYTLTDSADAVRAVVNALAEDSLVNVISTPSVMVLDNHTASINVGDQQPIQSAQTVSNGGNITQSIEFKDTGVQLEVTPTVNAGGLVTMDINQSVTDVGPVDSATGQRSFLNRDVTSRVAIRSGESVVLGGLIRDNSTQGNSGIPVLKDIPGLGALFSGTTENSTRTELLVFITPRVMRDQADLRDISREMRNRMKGIQYFGDLPLSARPDPVPAATQATSTNSP